MKQLMKFHYYTVRILAAFSGLCIVFLIVATGAEAIIRALKWGFIRGVIDLSEYALFFIAILAAPWLLNKDQHIRVDIVFANLKQPLQGRVNTLVNVLMLAVVLVIFYYSVQVLIESWVREEVIFKDLEIPDWWLQWQIPLASLLMVIELLQRIFWPNLSYLPDSRFARLFDEDTELTLASLDGEQ